jgi:hypothetical protein
VVLDFLDDDLGVMFVLIRFLTGVDRSSFAALLLMVLGVLVRADFAIVGVALRCAASLGVTGDLTLRLFARLGIRGREGFVFVSLDLFGGGIVGDPEAAAIRAEVSSERLAQSS